MEKKQKKKIGKSLVGIAIMIFVIGIGAIGIQQTENKTMGDTIVTSTTNLSNKKIGWGIKRSDNHLQPDLGNKNKELLDEYKGIAMGNSEKKYVYLTFDEGYEAGYTPRILQVLKDNHVKATFFLTAHFVNTRGTVGKRYDSRWTYYSVITQLIINQCQI